MFGDSVEALAVASVSITLESGDMFGNPGFSSLQLSCRILVFDSQ